MKFDDIRVQYTKKDVEILEEKNVYNGYFKMNSYKVRYKLFDGNWSRIFGREVLMRGDVVGVVLYDPSLDKVVLIEQFRIGALRDDHSPWLLECVAGVLDKNETLERTNNT